MTQSISRVGPPAMHALYFPAQQYRSTVGISAAPWEKFFTSFHYVAVSHITRNFDPRLVSVELSQRISTPLPDGRERRASL